MSIKMFGLFHLAENQKPSINMSVENFDEQLLTYINNAKSISHSLALNGINYTLLTNHKTSVSALASSDSRIQLAIQEIEFSTKVPSGIPFYSAHFKLDAFRHLASLPDGYYGLCDLDMLCFNTLPPCLENLIKRRIPVCYDITDQIIPAEGHAVIIRDLSAIGEVESEGRWTGGEFIAGPPTFFASLVAEVEKIYDNYISSIPQLHHIGDESFVSSALERMREGGTYIADGGSIGIVSRFWNTSTQHHQKPFNHLTEFFLLHLPADKNYLAKLAAKVPESSAQIRADCIKYQNSYASKARRLISYLKRPQNKKPQPGS